MKNQRALVILFFVGIINILTKIAKSFFIWKVKINENDYQNAQVIIGLSFGLRKNDPGISNKQLAKLVNVLQDKYKLPLILQWEIADYLSMTPKAGVIREHSEKGKYLDTYEGMRQSLEICKANNWTKAIIVSHPDHQWRVMMTAQQFGLQTIPADTSSVEYDPLSEQFWTRSKYFFIPREILGRILFIFKGWM